MNGVKWDTMGHRRSRHPVAKPICATSDLVLVLLFLGGKTNTALSNVKHGTKWPWICSTKVTDNLFLVTHEIGSNLGFGPENISNYTIQSISAIVLLLGGVDY